MPLSSAVSSRSRKRGRVTAGVLSLFFGATAVLVACGNAPDNNTVAKLLPQNTIGFTSAAIDPSNSQKLSLFQLSKHFPSKVQTDKANEVRDKIIAELFEGKPLNYDNDVKPWLGAEAAFAAVPSYSDDHIPVMVGAVKQTDKTKAQAALDKAKQKPNSYRFIGDYIFFVDDSQITKENATKALDDIENVSKNGKSLQDLKRFKDNIGTLHGEHLVLGWVDTPTAAREGIAAAKYSQAHPGSSPFSGVGSPIAAINYQPGAATVQTAADDQIVAPPNANPYGSTALGGLGLLSGVLGSDDSKKTTDDAYNKLQKEADDTGAFSFELYATSNSFVFEGITEKEPKQTGTAIETKIFNGLPNDTLGAMSVSDLGKNMRSALDDIEKNASSDAEFKKYQADVDKFVNSLGSEGVVFVHNSDPLTGGAVFELKDATAAQQVIDKWTASATQSQLATVADYAVSGGKGYDIAEASGASSTHLYIGIANGRLGITNNGDQLKAALAGNGQLSDQAPVKKALADQKLVFGSVYVNVDQAVAYAQKHGEKFTGDSGDWWKSIDVFGSQSFIKDGHYHTELHVGMK